MALKPHEVVAAVASRDPDRPAVVDDGVVTTYGDLVVRAATYAAALDGAPGDLVAVALPRGVDLVAAVLGVWGAGQVFLPVDPALPAARQEMIISDAAPATVLRTPLPPDPDAPPVEGECGFAYCVYTSGSTGRPKGALLTHDGLAVVVAAQRSVLGAAAADRVAQFASPGFDACVFELVFALAHGATLLVVPDEVRTDPEALLCHLAGHGVTVAILPSTMVAGMSRSARHTGSLRLIASAGDVLPVDAVRGWRHPVRLFNLYGPTEATIWTTAYECDPAADDPTVPIGRPIPGVDVLVVDDELLVTGPVVASGYLNRPDLTAQRFADVAGRRAYRTGDLVRSRPDGVLEFAGRRDHQVKLRGFRVELGEVEATLRAHPDVTDAVVLADGERLVAHVTPEVTADLRAYAATLLPAYMVPARVHAVAAFPLTASGKADRAALAATAWSPADEPPCTPDEHAVAAIWCDVLALPDCGRLDTFHACGGHSLTAARLANRLTADLDVPIDVLDVLRCSTVAALAALVAERRATAPDRSGHAAVPPVGAPPSLAGDAPASAAQQQVSYAIEVDGRAEAYVARACVGFHGPLDVPALEAALWEVVRRHEIFRTRFVLRDGELTQQVEGDVDFDLLVTGRPEAQVWPELVADVLDPATLPLVRWALVRKDLDHHVLLHAEHHYVHDGWSYRVFLDELACLYSGRTPAPPVQFAEFTRAQRTWLTSRAAARAADHWRAALAGAPPPAALPRLASGAGDGRGGLLRRVVPAGTLEHVDAVAAALGATPFQVMFGAFTLLLSRHAGTGDLIVGTTLANRSSARWERVIGMIVNLVPVRVCGEAARTVGEYLAAARDGLLDALRWGELPLSRIVAETGVREPTVLFNAHSALTGDVAFAGLRTEVIEALANEVAKFPLNVTLIPGTDRTELLVEYSPARFGASAVEQLSTTYLDLLAALRVDQPVADADRFLPPPPPLTGGNTYGRPWHGGVAARFGAAAAVHPDAVAVVAGDRVTYARLRRRADAYAAHLSARGVRRGELVGLLLDRGPELIAAMVGVLRAGAVYVPLDPHQPAARTATVVAEAGARVVLDHPVPETDDVPDEVPLGPDDPAYCSFTSGSTGVPKGVLVPHGALENVLDFFHDQAPDRFARVLALTPTTFDIANLELLLPLCHGDTVVLADRDQARDGESLLDLFDAHDVTAVQATPATWRLVTASPRWQGRTLLAMCGGEALPRELSAAIRAGTDELWNLYGPTETTIWSTWHRCTGTDAPHEPIGHPIANTAVHVLGPDGCPVPDGEVGEVVIGGAGVALGYVGKPELTAARFVADPFAPDRATMYRTGDLARRSLDGLEFLGRVDDQVKVNGHRVEPGEIEVALRAEPGVRDGVVVTRTGVLGDATLVAFVIGDAAGVRDRLAERLPAYLVPSAVHAVAGFPLTPNGKIDRAALLAGTEADPAPARWADARLAALFAEVDPEVVVDPGADFTALGLHSLALMRLAAHCLREYGVPLTVTDLRRCATPAGLSALLAAHQDGHDTEAGQLGISDGPPVLSPAQERMWLLSQTPGASRAYHVPLRFRLTGDLDETALMAALTRIVERHDALRTGVALHGDRPVPRPLPAVVGTGGVDAPFDHADGPLVRVALTREAPGTHLLTITTHHLATDDWSCGVLLRELAALYRAFTRGEPDPLPPLPVRYADHAAWLRRRLPALGGHAEHWRLALAGVTVLEVPTDRPRQPVPDHLGAVETRTLGAALTDRVRAFGARHGTTAFETVTASWVAVLGRICGQDDIVIGAAVANRTHASVHDLIGLFVDTVALRFDLSGDPSVAEWAARVRTSSRIAQEHAEFPFEQVVALTGARRPLGHHPLFDVFVTWQDPAGTLDLPGILAVEEPPAHVTARFDLALALTDHGDRIEARMEYATALFDAATAQRHLDCWTTLLSAMVDDDSGATPVAALPILSPPARAQVLEEWNDTAVPFPADRCLHDWVVAQAARTPGRVAVRHGVDTLTYAELNRRANRVAWRLRELGAAPDDRVAVCLDRGTDLVVAILGVLKSGAAYVTVDPALPPLRRDALLASCRPVALVGDLPWGGLVVNPAAPEALDTDPPPLAQGHHVAYVLHTSGSTGTPKGVQVEHRNVANLLNAWLRRANLPDSGFAASLWTDAGFDVSVFELFAPLAAGGTVHIVPAAVRTDQDALVGWLREHAIEHAYLPPFVVRRLDVAPLPLRTLLVGVEPLRERDLYRIAAANPGLRVVNGYGPTEATVFCTTYDTIGDRHRTVPIGRPIDNTRVYVLDAHGGPLPVGVPGELCVAGAPVARGYLDGVPGGFTIDPFTGGRMYRTGDLARWLPDGTLEFLGRRDDQIKVRGHRVEPGEITSALTARSDIVEACVTAGADTLVVHYAGTATPAELRDHLLARLPAALVPAAFVAVPALPLLPSGKVDRSALPLPDGAAVVHAACAPPEGDAETALAAVWTALLGGVRVGRGDDFFALGGHSLLAVRLVGEVRAAFDVDFTMDDVFAHPVLAAMAARVVDLDLAAFDPAELAVLLGESTQE